MGYAKGIRFMLLFWVSYTSAAFCCLLCPSDRL